LLPNDTDFSEFKSAGIPGMNFAYIGGITSYHTQLDTPANLDQRSLQHQGLYALSLARHFGNAGSEYGGANEAVYFKPVNGFFVSYSRVWVIPLTLLTAAFLITIVVLGLKRKLFTASGIILGFLAQLLSAAVAWGAGTVIWLALRGKADGWMYKPHFFAIGFVVLTIGLFVALYILFSRKISLHSLAAGAMLLWLVLLTAVTIYMPGASYLFAWPLLLGALALAAVTLYSRERPAWVYLVLMLCAVPTLLLWSQTLHQIYQAMTLNVVGPLMAVVALVCGLLLPQFGLLSRRQLWLIPATGALLCIAFLVAGFSSSKFDEERPKMNSIFYVMNADTNQAVWASVDEVRDEWTSQYLVGNTVKGSLIDYLPLTYRGFTIASAPLTSLAAPEAVLLADTTTNGARTLRLHVRSGRRAPFVTVDVGPGTELRRALLDDKPLGGILSEPRRDADIGWTLWHHTVSDDGLKLTLETAAGRPLKIRVTDRTAGLPQLPSVKNIPRPEHIMRAPYPYSDTTSISKTFTF
ncbi:MAG TPA: M28 family peptidase, partial [Pyrinomonadaceae bacterium]